MQYDLTELIAIVADESVIDAPNGQQRTALHEAVSLRRMLAAQQLIGQRASLHSQDGQGRMVLDLVSNEQQRLLWQVRESYLSGQVISYKGQLQTMQGQLQTVQQALKTVQQAFEKEQTEKIELTQRLEDVEQTNQDQRQIIQAQEQQLREAAQKEKRLEEMIAQQKIQLEEQEEKNQERLSA